MKYINIKFDNEEFLFNTDDKLEIQKQLDIVKEYIDKSIDSHIDLNLEITFFDPDVKIKELEQKLKEKENRIKELESSLEHYNVSCYKPAWLDMVVTD